ASANANVKRKRAWGDMASVGSRTIRNSQEYLRKAGATAREMLIAAAAQQWGVPASECSASNSFITHGAGGRRLSFGKVADAADNWWRAKEALRDVHIEWDVGANGNVSSASLMEFYKGGLDAQTDVATARQDGDFDQAFASAAKKIEAEYYTPYLAHSCLEPMGCTAIVKDGKVDVWTSTQNAEASLANAAATAGVPLENVEVHRVQLGGGFGRRGGAQDFVRQGVAIAKA